MLALIITAIAVGSIAVYSFIGGIAYQILRNRDTFDWDRDDAQVMGVLWPALLAYFIIIYPPLTFAKYVSGLPGKIAKRRRVRREEREFASRRKDFPAAKVVSR